MKYQVTVTETLSRVVNIESSSAEEAEDKVRSLYRKEAIVLDWNDFTQVDISARSDDEHHPAPYFRSADHAFTLLHGDCLELLKLFDFKFDMIFADPPYFLSNGGISYQSGKVVSVNKGEWDRGLTPRQMHEFNYNWLELCRDKLKENGTIWVSGTYHNIFSVATCMQELGYKILNVVTWAKTNPPPNISCRYFTYSTEFVIWARKDKKTPHFFNYKLMKTLNDGKQMTDVWRLPAIARWEKGCGKHPTQKPLALLARIIMASTRPAAWVLDPFAGSSTTGIAANLVGRRFLGIEKETEYVDMGVARKREIESEETFRTYRMKIHDIAKLEEAADGFGLDGVSEPEPGPDLPFAD